MKIIKLKQGLVNNEFFTFLKLLAAIILNHNPASLKVKPQYDALVAFFDALQKGLDKEKYNVLTKLLNDLDHERDLLIIGFLKWLDALTYHPDDKTNEHAAYLLRYVQGFGKKIASLSFFAETSILNSIVDGIQSNKDYSDALNAINGTVWLAAIDSKNKEFASQYSNRIITDTSMDKVESFSEIRYKATDAYETLINVLMSRYTADSLDKLPVDSYETTIAEINDLITKSNILVKTSKPHTSTPTKQPTPTTPTANPGS